jgi:hypothetical protein
MWDRRGLGEGSTQPRRRRSLSQLHNEVRNRSTGHPRSKDYGEDGDWDRDLGDEDQVVQRLERLA